MEYLLNFKRTSDGGTTVCNHLLGFCFGKRDFEVEIVGLVVTSKDIWKRGNKTIEEGGR